MFDYNVAGKTTPAEILAAIGTPPRPVPIVHNHKIVKMKGDPEWSPSARELELSKPLRDAVAKVSEKRTAWNDAYAAHSKVDVALAVAVRNDAYGDIDRYRAELVPLAAALATAGSELTAALTAQAKIMGSEDLAKLMQDDAIANADSLQAAALAAIAEADRAVSAFNEAVAIIGRDEASEASLARLRYRPLWSHFEYPAPGSLADLRLYTEAFNSDARWHEVHATREAAATIAAATAEAARVEAEKADRIARAEEAADERHRAEIDAEATTAAEARDRVAARKPTTRKAS